MKRQFLIAKHKDLITATELDGSGSQATFAPVLRFQSISELSHHFSTIGAPADALQLVREMFAANGMATLEFKSGFENS